MTVATTGHTHDRRCEFQPANPRAPRIRRKPVYVCAATTPAHVGRTRGIWNAWRRARYLAASRRYLTSIPVPPGGTSITEDGRIDWFLDNTRRRALARWPEANPSSPR